MSEEAPAPPVEAPPSPTDSASAHASEGPATPPTTPPTTPPPELPATRRGRRRHGRHAVKGHPRRWWRSPWVVAAVLLVVVAAASAGGAELRLRRPDAPPTVTQVLAPRVATPAAPLTLPWPSTGQAAVAVPSLGVTLASAVEQPVAVASLTKLVTAYVVLHDHPLLPGQPGPSVTVTLDDVYDYAVDNAQGNSDAAVAVGEQLTEAQLLAGLLVHSADNYADLLARWDAGSIAAFVDKMNATAVTLGMTQSHFADASGISAQSQSTASDMLKVAALDMEDPLFASLVRLPEVSLPVAGTIPTYTPLLGVPGVIGVKSGYSTAAGGCDVLGAERNVGGHTVLVLAAVTGQEGASVLTEAGMNALALVGAAGSQIRSTPVVRRGQVVADVGASGQSVGAAASQSASLPTWPGISATRRFVPARGLNDQSRRGTRAGTVVATFGTERVRVPVRLQGDVPSESLLQRLF